MIRIVIPACQKRRQTHQPIGPWGHHSVTLGDGNSILRLVGPTEVRSVDPHAMKDGRKPSRHGDRRLLEAAPFGHSQTPRLQGRVLNCEWRRAFAPQSVPPRLLMCSATPARILPRPRGRSSRSPYLALYAHRKVAQDSVAGLVSESVVDVFEVVEVEPADATDGVCRSLQHFFHSRSLKATIGNARKLVWPLWPYRDPAGRLGHGPAIL